MVVEEVKAMYSKTVMDHFKNPRNVGVIEDSDGIGEIGNPLCGDMMSIYLQITDNTIEDIKFQTFGCGAAIAVSSMLTELAKGKSVEEVKKSLTRTWPRLSMVCLKTSFTAPTWVQTPFTWPSRIMRLARRGNQRENSKGTSQTNTPMMRSATALTVTVRSLRKKLSAGIAHSVQTGG
jgi:hypothetical protein